MSEILISIAITSLAASLAGLVRALYDKLFRKKKEMQAVERTNVKIDRLSNMLKEAGNEIEELEHDIKAKSKKVAELDELSRRLDSLASLREEQVEAIKDELRSTFKESNRLNRMWTIVIGAIWFILGLIVRGFLRF